MGPGSLSQVLRQVDARTDDKNLLVGTEHSDDAAVYRITDNRAIIQSLDFFTPIVDDPYLYGQIAAANSFSDIYAMGGKPILAMNIVCYPSFLCQDTLVKILQGGADKIQEAGAVMAGGHTVEDDEPKYGLAVTGEVAPDKIIMNSGAKPGDKLILTKPLGTGIIATAIKGGLTDEQERQEVIENMTALNDGPARIMADFKVTACTDITGFGFLGHAVEMAAASRVELKINVDKVTIYPDVLEYAEMGVIPAGACKNSDHFGDRVIIDNDIAEEYIDALYDPQTSGGLLISVPEKKAADFLSELHQQGVDEAVIVGEVRDNKGRVYIG